MSENTNQDSTQVSGNEDGQEQQANGQQQAVEYDLKAPEGFEQADVEQFTAAAKELGLTNDQAQKLLEQQAQQKSSFQQSALDSFKAMTEQWLEEAKSDQEIGGDNFEVSLQYATSALDKFASPEFKQTLNETGYGNHPEMVRIFARIGKALSEDQPVGDETNQGGEADRAKILYGNMT